MGCFCVYKDEDTPLQRPGENNDQFTLREPMSQRRKDLVKAWQRGSAEAYEEIVRKFYRSLLRTILPIVQQDEDARDISQEAFIRGYTRIGRFDNERQFFFWLRKVAVNLAIDQLRKKKSRPWVHGVQFLGDLPSGEPRSAEKLMASELSDQVRKAIETLPPRQRAAVTLCLIEGLSGQEVAKILGCTVGSVKVSLSIAKRKLAKMLKLYLREEK